MWSLYTKETKETKNFVMRPERNERNTKPQTPSSTEIPESKHQKPSSKHQRNPKFQAPNRGPRFELGARSFSGVWSLVFGVWDLVLLWSLEFGIWSLLAGLLALQKVRCSRP